jgi:hypothetical protein
MNERFFLEDRATGWPALWIGPIETRGAMKYVRFEGFADDDFATWSWRTTARESGWTEISQESAMLYLEHRLSAVRCGTDAPAVPDFVVGPRSPSTDGESVRVPG